MKCKNCGAELNNGKCEYCGSVFLEDMRYVTINIPPEKMKKVVNEWLKDGKRYLGVVCLKN